MVDKIFADISRDRINDLVGALRLDQSGLKKNGEISEISFFHPDDALVQLLQWIR